MSTYEAKYVESFIRSVAHKRKFTTWHRRTGRYFQDFQDLGILNRMRLNDLYDKLYAAYWSGKPLIVDVNTGEWHEHKTNTAQSLESDTAKQAAIRNPDYTA